jgi:acetate---CoA ligase (ADP-forming)
LTRFELGRLMKPETVAVVGANDRPGSYGSQALLNLEAIGFGGEVWGVNPKRSEVLGRPCVPSIADLPVPVDAVIVAIPAAGVPGVVDEAGARGCGGAVVFSAGFGEVGSGESLQRELVAAAARHDFPVCGPNCNGIVAMHSRVALWGDALHPRDPGAVALVSQSGNVAVNALATRRGLRFHSVIATGNQAVLTAADYLSWVAGQDGVASVALYLEDDGDATICHGLAACAEAGIRVVVLKVGSSPAGAGAAAAHSAALAGDQRVFRALVEEAGAEWADDVHELLELAKTLAVRRADRRPSAGRGLAIMTCSGGDSAQGADEASRLGLALPELGPATQARLRELLPPTATVGNPLDYTAMIWGDSRALGELVRAVGEDAAVDQVLVFYDQPAGLEGAVEESWRAVRDGIAGGAALSPAPTVVASTLPELLDDDAAWRFAQAGVPAAAGLRTGLRCAHAAMRAPGGGVERLREIAAAASALPGSGSGHGSGEWLAEHDAKRLLRDAGVAVVDGRVVADEQDAITALHELGGCVAVKLSAPGTLHKSDLGGVSLGLRTEHEVSSAYRAMAALADAHDGYVLVEAMAAPGVELLVAATTDGIVPSLLLGLGGVWTELLDDVAVVPLPADPERVERTLRSLRGSGLLLGARGGAAMDVGAAARLAARLGEALLEESLQLVELNPVIVSASGAVAVDAAARRGATGPVSVGSAGSAREGAPCTT